jgi:hypothetical protein
MEYECLGFVPNVVFPTGIIQQEDSLLIYAGAADTATCVVELGLADLLISDTSQLSRKKWGDGRSTHHMWASGNPKHHI